MLSELHRLDREIGGLSRTHLLNTRRVKRNQRQFIGRLKSNLASPLSLSLCAGAGFLFGIKLTQRDSDSNEPHSEEQHKRRKASLSQVRRTSGIVLSTIVRTGVTALISYFLTTDADDPPGKRAGH